MLDHGSALGWKGIVCALIFTASHGVVAVGGVEPLVRVQVMDVRGAAAGVQDPELGMVPEVAVVDVGRIIRVTGLRRPH